MLAGNPAHIRSTNPPRLGSLTNRSSEIVQYQPAIQHTYSPLHRGSIHLLATAPKESGVSWQPSTHTVNFTAVRFTYFLWQRRRAVLAASSTHTQSTASRFDSPTLYSSEGEQCQPPTQHTQSTPSRKDSLTFCGSERREV